MLTRHLYGLHEVAYSLHNALRHGHGKEAVFWARELILSEEDDTLYLTMLQAWVVWLGAPAVSWLDLWTMLDSRDIGGCQRMTLVAEFCRMRNDLPKRRAPYALQAFVMAARGFADIQDLGQVETALETNDAFTFYHYLGPEFAKSPLSVIETVAGYVETPELFNGFKNALKNLRGEIQLKRLIGATAVQTLCMSEWPAELEASGQREVAGWLKEWEPLLGTSAGRIYTTVALKKGGTTYNYTSPFAMMREGGCRFWQSLIETIDSEKSPEALELVARFFPDGLPEGPEAAAASGRNVVKPDQRMLAVWGFAPAIRKSWQTPLKQLFDGVGVPDR
jgi:hypothetical protein